MNRPKKKNAINREMYNAMRHALTEADLRDDIHVILLKGLKDSFTVGNDLADFNDRKSDEMSPGGKFLLAIHNLQKPIIAAVNGLAVGIGTTVLFHCDLAYASNTAKFRLPFVNLGVCPEAGSTLSLPSKCGYLSASELFLFGKFFDSEEALNHRIINRIHDSDDLNKIAWDRAKELANKPLEAVLETKRLMKASTQKEMQERIIEELDVFGKLLRSEASIAARKGVLEKSEKKGNAA